MQVLAADAIWKIADTPRKLRKQNQNGSDTLRALQPKSLST
jgi:hypothetical protein